MLRRLISNFHFPAQAFNKEFEELSNTQRGYSVPDIELRESLKRDNKEYILPKYQVFYEKYSQVQFSKHGEKYIKYTPAQVSSVIDTLFDVAAWKRYPRCK